MLPELRNIKNIMNARSNGKVKSISHSANAIQHLEGAIKLRCQFSINPMKNKDLKIGMKLNINKIPYLKLAITAMFISQLLHSVLSSSEVKLQ